jgi:hypothetical protein
MDQSSVVLEIDGPLASTFFPQPTSARSYSGSSSTGPGSLVSLFVTARLRTSGVAVVLADGPLIVFTG